MARLTATTHGASFYYTGVTLILLLWRLPLGPLSPVDRRLGLWLALMLPPLFLYAHGRTDYLHVTPLLVFSLLLAALLVVPSEKSDQEGPPDKLAASGERAAGRVASLLHPRDLLSRSGKASAWRSGARPCCS